MCHSRGVAVGRLVLVGWSTLLAVALTPVTVYAQDHPRLEVGGGVTFLESGDIVEGYGSGWMASGTWYVVEWLGLTLEVSRNTRSQTLGFLDVKADFRAILAGPRFAWRTGPLVPFGRVLGGVTKILTEASAGLPFPSTGRFDETHHTIQLGAGVDIPMTRRLAARVAYDYRRMFAHEAIDQHRFLIGAVVGL